MKLSGSLRRFAPAFLFLVFSATPVFLLADSMTFVVRYNNGPFPGYPAPSITVMLENGSTPFATGTTDSQGSVTLTYDPNGPGVPQPQGGRALAYTGVTAGSGSCSVSATELLSNGALITLILPCNAPVSATGTGTNTGTGTTTGTTTGTGGAPACALATQVTYLQICNGNQQFITAAQLNTLHAACPQAWPAFLCDGNSCNQTYYRCNSSYLIGEPVCAIGTPCTLICQAGGWFVPPPYNSPVCPPNISCRTSQICDPTGEHEGQAGYVQLGENGTGTYRGGLAAP